MPVLSARQFIGAGTTALSLIAGAFLLALAAGNARAQGSAPCDAAGEIALLPSSREKRTCGRPNVKTSYSRRGGRADRARNQSAIMRASRRMMNERESAPEGIFGNDRSPCQRRKFRAPESVAARTQFNRNSCRGCALTTRPCDGPRTVAFSPSVKMNDCYQGRSMKSGEHGGSGKTHRRYRLLARLWAVDDIH